MSAEHIHHNGLNSPAMKAWERSWTYHYIRHEILESLPWLPERIRVDELKKFGLVNLLHIVPNRSTNPWLPAGCYKFIGFDGKLYVLEITSTVVKGIKVCAWLYQPSVRVKNDKNREWDE